MNIILVFSFDLHCNLCLEKVGLCNEMPASSRTDVQCLDCKTGQVHNIIWHGFQKVEGACSMIYTWWERVKFKMCISERGCMWRNPRCVVGGESQGQGETEGKGTPLQLLQTPNMESLSRLRNANARYLNAYCHNLQYAKKPTLVDSFRQYQIKIWSWDEQT